MTTKNLRKSAILITISILIGVLSGVLAYTNVLEKWELKMNSKFFTKNTPDSDIVIVGVDPKSIDPETGLGIVQNWPRTYYAQVINAISKDHPKVIGIDIRFRSSSNFITSETLNETLKNNPDAVLSTLKSYTDTENHPYDLALAEAIKSAGNVILIKTGVTDNETTAEKTLTWKSESTSIDSIKNAAQTSAFNNTIFAEDKSIRTIPLGWFVNNKFTNTFAVTIAKFVLGVDFNTTTAQIKTQNTELNIPINQGYITINYATLPYPEGYTTIPFIDVYNNKIPANTFNNKIVLIGFIAESLKDQFPTPHLDSTGDLMPGVEIHANAIQMILEGNFLEEESPFMVGIVTFFYALLIAICASYLRIRWAPLYIAIFFIDYWFFAQYAFAHGLPGISGTSIVNGETVRHKMLFAIATPYLCMGIAYLTTLAYRYATEVKARLALKTAFSYYLAPAVVEKIADKPEQVRLGGERRDMTFLFSDIHDFTPFSESRDPAEVARTLNEYFTVMADCVFAEAGTLDKFEGDALMAFWGAPLDQPDHPSRAIRAALRMQIALKKLHEKWQTENRPLLTCRIGINSGEAIVGNMGSNRRFDYTAIGDNVNLASRLEQANKQFNSTLLVSDETIQRIQKDPTLAKLQWKALGEITVKGKSKAIKVWTISN